MLIVNEKISIPIVEFKFSYSRSPGPGGQNVNKVNSKVTLKWNVRRSKSLPVDVGQRLTEKYRRRISKTGEFVITSHRFRDQGRNVADTMQKLRELILSVATMPKKRIPKKKTKASNRRRLENKRKNSDRKQSRKTIRTDG